MQQEASSSTLVGPDIGLVFDLAPLPLLVLSPAWRITRASSRFLADWRVSRDDCIGQELLPFVKAQLRPLRPTHLAQLTTSIDDAIAARAERTTNPINARHAASWKARVVPVFDRDQLLSIVLEWHEGPPSHAEDDLVEPGLSTDEAFRILVQAVKDYAIFLLDTKGHIATWNTGAELLKGYTRDEIIGRHFSLFYGKEDFEIKKPEMELEICMREGRVEDEGWRYRKDGSRFWANVIITAVYKNGVHVGFGKVTRDLTERKSAESRLIAAYEESEKLKSDFLANMSHEIRTPMHGMLSACTLLLDTPLSARQRDMVSIMDESGQVLLQVINDILDYSKLTSGNFSIHADIVGITSIVTSVVRSVQATLPPSVYFELFLAADLPRSVQGDPLRYRQILQNIVGNAAKFTEKGSIRVKVSVDREDDDGYLVLTEVTDTGIGVPEAATTSLFTPFMQFDATTTKQYKGTGLGLSIAKSLTELMGGTIGHRPNPQRNGSVFWFTARFNKIKSLEQMQDWKRIVTRREPRDRTTTPIADTPDDELQKELRIVSATKNLLLVEDNLINQKVMLGMLRSMGFKNVGLASNGVEAVRMVRGKPAAYDLVLMDINMPIMDGHAATKDIRAAGILVPVIAMTAYALKGDRELCLEHGMNDYIAKPVDKKRLARVLGKWLLRMTDYRKNYEERLAELRRHQESLGQVMTPGLEAKQFLFDVANGPGPNQAFGHLAPATPPAEEPRRTPASDNPHPLLTKDVSGAPEASKGRDGLHNAAAEINGFSLRLPTRTGTSDQAGDPDGKAKQPSHGIQPGMESVAVADTTDQQGHAPGKANGTPDAKSGAAQGCQTADNQNPEAAEEATKRRLSVECVETQPRLAENGVNISVNETSLSGAAAHGPAGDSGVASVDAIHQPAGDGGITSVDAKG
jgi:osomolarity two-component system sensor histidine kinase TcsA